MEPLGPRNARVKAVRRLARQGRERADRRAFVVEGQILVDEAIAAGLRPEEVFLQSGLHRDYGDGLVAGGIGWSEVTEAAMTAMATTVSPQPVLAVCPMPDPPALPELGLQGHVLVLDGVADPGNAGTILRTAEASGAAAVVFGQGSVDPFSPKVVRSTAGSIFRVPVLSGLEVIDAVRELGRHRPVVATAADAPVHYDHAELADAVIVLGNEAHGVSREVLQTVASAVAIPQEGGGESLNVAMAATVLAFEAARQRRNAP